MRWLACLLFALPLAAQLQPQITCDATAEPLLVRSEGLTELTGVIALDCRGTPNLTVSGSLIIYLSAPVTNRLTGDNVNVRLTIETTPGVEQTLQPQAFLLSPTAVMYPTFSFTMPPSGFAILRIHDIRVASRTDLENSTITATLATSGQTGIGIRNTTVVVAVPRRGLYANTSVARILCRGSQLPEEISFTGLIAAGAAFSTIRVTEGSPGVFERLPAGAQNGVRILIRYSGFPASARVFVPNLIAGSSAINPTSAGDLGVVTSGGVYGPTLEGSLLLARVPNADSAGAGDAPNFNPALVTQPVILNSVSEVPLQGGQGWVTYEVVDSNSRALESAQIPTFVALPPNSPPAVASARVSFAPLSNVATASPSLPILRFRDVPPPVDCTVLRDCNASYFPRLFVDAPPLTFSAPQGRAGFYQKFIRVLNEGGGAMVWSADIRYLSGDSWLRIFPDAGVNNTSLNLSAFPERLPKGNYEAVLTIDAGPVAGVRTFPVSLTVTDPLPEIPVISSLPVFVPGSLATLTGRHLIGEVTRVTFDGIDAEILRRQVSAGSESLTLVVPVELGRRPAAQLQVLRDNVPSAPVTVPLAAAAPTILGVLNQDGQPNAQSLPETTGRFFQVFATGLPHPSLGVISAWIHDRQFSPPPFAGPAPSLNGVQQVNFPIPDDLPTMSTEVRLCGASLANPAERICSRPFLAWIERPPGAE
jgi:uncharacterized protein (TIGR03437 family)